MPKIDVPSWVKTTITVVLFAVAIWGAGWAASKDSSITANIVNSHEKRLSSVELDAKKFEQRMDSLEKMNIKYEATQKTLLDGQNELKMQIQRQNELLMKKIESDAEMRTEIKALLRGNNAE